MKVLKVDLLGLQVEEFLHLYYTKKCTHISLGVATR